MKLNKYEKVFRVYIDTKMLEMSKIKRLVNLFCHLSGLELKIKADMIYN